MALGTSMNIVVIPDLIRNPFTQHWFPGSRIKSAMTKRENKARRVNQLAFVTEKAA